MKRKRGRLDPSPLDLPVTDRPAAGFLVYESLDPHDAAEALGWDDDHLRHVMSDVRADE
jgi:hypothetical protein